MARFGAEIITTRSELAVAEHAVMDAIEHHGRGTDAVIIAVSFDVGVRAARERLSVPVIGITEASLKLAMTQGQRIGVVAFGNRCVSIYRQLVQSYGVTRRVVGYVPVELPPAKVYAEPGVVDDIVTEAANQLIRNNGADVVIVTGAAMTGIGKRLTPRLPVPLLDGLTSAAVLTASLARLHSKVRYR